MLYSIYITKKICTYVLCNKTKFFHKTNYKRIVQEILFDYISLNTKNLII